ncbi:MAG TPA: stage II sporulation protein M [Mobilitalea sp.]|nr:stage II sporulation protein M [Mobilitalea sp.]
MKQKFQLHRLSAIQVAIVLLILGLFFGVLFANIFRDSYQEQMTKYQSTIFTDVTQNNIDYAGLFRYVLVKNYKEFFVFWLLSITILGIPYMAYKVINFGFFAGFFVSCVTIQFGLKGILLVLVYEFPHGLLYLPIILISLYKGFQLSSTVFRDNRNHIGGISKLVKSNLIIILLLAVGLLFASFLEAYAGSFLLKKTLGLFT